MSKQIKILITGGSGFIGRYLSQFLSKKGYSIYLLGRKRNNMMDYPCYVWDPSEGKIDAEALCEKNAIVNLSGAGIADRLWTRKRKEIIYRSRIDSTALLVKTIIENNNSPSLFINASAIGYYGNRPQEKLTEISTPGKDFIAKLCEDWEQQVIPLKNAGIPISILRIGIVLGRNGGSFPKLVMPLQFRMNILFAHGNHVISWVHIHDLARIIEELIAGKLQPGIHNAVSPNPLSQKAFNDTALNLLRKKALKLNIPKFALRSIMGELTSVITADQNVEPQNLSNQKFRYSYPDIQSALTHLLK